MKHFNQLLLAGLFAGLLAGCASAPSKFYSLNATATREAAPTSAYGVVVGPVFVPTSVDRPQFVLTASPNRVEFEEFNRWDAPLAESIARVVSLNLGAMLGTTRVAAAPMPDFGPAYRVTIRVQRFESTLGTAGHPGSALLDALWSVRGQTGDDLVSGHTIASEPVAGASFDTLAAAHSRAITKVSDEIANAIRPFAEK